MKIKLGFNKDCLGWKTDSTCITYSDWPEQNQFLAVASPWRLPRSAQTLIPGKTFLHQGVIKPNSLSGVVNEILGDFLYVHQPWFLGGLRKVEKVSRESFSAKNYSLILENSLADIFPQTDHGPWMHLVKTMHFNEFSTSKVVQIFARSTFAAEGLYFSALDWTFCGFSQGILLAVKICKYL